MSKTIKFGNSTVSEDGPCYVIAEIGHNHQGELDKALQLVGAQ
jgi:sialic acid synthase SpsE